MILLLILFLVFGCIQEPVAKNKSKDKDDIEVNDIVENKEEDTQKEEIVGNRVILQEKYDSVSIKLAERFIELREKYPDQNYYVITDSSTEGDVYLLNGFLIDIDPDANGLSAYIVSYPNEKKLKQVILIPDGHLLLMN